MKRVLIELTVFLILNLCVFATRRSAYSFLFFYNVSSNHCEGISHEGGEGRPLENEVCILEFISHCVQLYMFWNGSCHYFSLIAFFFNLKYAWTILEVS